MPTTAHPSVCVSIVNWNTTDHVLELIASLEALHPAPKHIVVVDNHSQQDPTAAIAEHHPAVRVIRLPENVGFASGHKVGAAFAEQAGDALLWMLNPDLQIDAHTLNGLLDAYAQHPNAILGSVPLRINADQRTDTAQVTFAKKFFRTPFREPVFPEKRLHTYAELFPKDENRTAAAVHGCSMAVPLQVIRTHGFMDESYFLYGEEIDYGLRLGNEGVPSIFVAASKVFHIGGAATAGYDRVSDVVMYYKVRNHLLRTWRFQSKREYASLLMRKFVGIAQLVVLPPRRPRRAWFAFLGMLDALRGKRGKTFAPESQLAAMH